jgi:hypothetical protein
MKNFGLTSSRNAKLSKLTVLGAVLAAFVCLASTARADSTNGTYWNCYLDVSSCTSLIEAPVAASAPTATPSATFTATSSSSGTVFSFDLPGKGYNGDSDLYKFLTAGGDTVTGVNGTTGAGTDNINNGVFEFTGYTTLVAGTQYEFTHDDGLILYLTDSNGITTKAINSPGATAADTSDFTVSKSGTYYYEVLYAEVNGGPGVLTSDIVSNATPEPSALLFMGTGLLGLALLVFWRGKAPRLVHHS